MDATNMPVSYYCPHEHKSCDAVPNCLYRMRNDDCMLRALAVRQLGTMKRKQNMFYRIGELLCRIWGEREHISSHDRKYLDIADRD